MYKIRTMSLLIVAEITAMSLWFVSAAVLGDMMREATLSAAAQAILSTSVQVGFVVAAVLAAVLGLADRFDPRKLFALSALAAACANGALLWAPIGGNTAIVLRFVTGACLAGVYPVGMKIAVGWGVKDRGFLLGLLVFGSTLGTAAPYLLAYLGGADWHLTVIAASTLAVVAAVLVMFTTTGPYHQASPAFNPAAILLAWTDTRIRRTYAGYLGHMWELYAMWAWISAALTISYGETLSADHALEFAKLTAFVSIGAGAVACVAGGWVADRIGKAEMTIAAMALSGASGVAFALAFGGPIWLTFVIVVIWGATIIPDSAQFSALVADFTPPEMAGSLIMLQTALGFTLTAATVQVTPMLADVLGWPAMMAGLALGPAAGIWAMWGLRRTPRAPCNR